MLALHEGGVDSHLLCRVDTFELYIVACLTSAASSLRIIRRSRIRRHAHCNALDGLLLVPRLDDARQVLDRLLVLVYIIARVQRLRVPKGIVDRNTFLFSSALRSSHRGFSTAVQSASFTLWSPESLWGSSQTSLLGCQA